MLPTFDLGPWHVHTYGVLVSLALIVIGMYGFQRLLRLGLPVGFIIRGGLLTILGGITVAYLVFYVPRLVNLIRPGALGEDGSLRITWVLVGSPTVAALYCWKHKIPLGRAFDLGVLPCPLGQAIARLGCFAAGCCFGKPTDSWLGVNLPDVHGYWAVRYPTQLLDAAANLLIFVILLIVERYGTRRGGGWPFDGFLFLLFVELFFLKRFIMAFMRQDAAPALGTLSWMHLHAMVGVVIATALIAWNLYHTADPRGLVTQT